MSHYIYFVALLILVIGLIIMLTSDNYLKKIIGLGIFQNSVLIFYIALGKINNAHIPIDQCKISQPHCHQLYSAPLNHVLMLTAIVVGFSTLSVGLALIYQIYQRFGTLSEIEITKIADKQPHD